MTDKKVDLGCVVAVAVWSAAAVILIASWPMRDVYLATVACLLALVAGTATIRVYFVTQNQMMRNAFELGKDARRGVARIR